MPMYHQTHKGIIIHLWPLDVVYHDIGLFYVWAKCINWATIFIHIEDIYTKTEERVQSEGGMFLLYISVYIWHCVFV